MGAIECSVRGVQHELLVEGATLGNKQFLPALELRAQYIRLAVCFAEGCGRVCQLYT